MSTERLLLLAGLTPTQRKLLTLADNETGRLGWSLQQWEAPGGARDACAPLVKAGMLREKRLGGYQGVEITPRGRRAAKQLAAKSA